MVMGIGAVVVVIAIASRSRDPGPSALDTALAEERSAREWVRVAGYPATGQVALEFANRSGRALRRVDVRIRETDQANRVVRDHYDSARDLSVGQAWVFPIRVATPGNTLTVSEVALR
jgi:hypothetical protein